jgi:sRNA-binding protein
LAFYTGNSGYLYPCRKVGTARIDLPSAAIDVVNKAGAEHACKILKQRRQKRLATAEQADLAAIQAVTGVTLAIAKKSHGAPGATVASCKE